jgi:hypothetical protein
MKQKITIGELAYMLKDSIDDMKRHDDLALLEMVDEYFICAGHLLEIYGAEPTEQLVNMIVIEYLQIESRAYEKRITATFKTSRKKKK